MLRGRPSEARQYFERVVREYPDSARVARGTIWLVRSYFDERDMSRGCQVLGSLPVGQVPDGELQLQVNELRRRCTSVVTASTAAAPAARRQTDGDKAANSAPSRTAGRFSVQLAAFNTRREADAAVARFKRVGVDTRVDGTSRPFRIRTGRYGTRAEAAEVLATLRKQGHRGFVVEITP